MKTFFKYFSISLIIQVFVISFSLVCRMGDLLLLPYWIPYALLPPTEPSQQYNAGILRIIVLFSVPAIFYSLIFSLIAVGVKQIKMRQYLR